MSLALHLKAKGDLHRTVLWCQDFMTCRGWARSGRGKTRGKSALWRRREYDAFCKKKIAEAFPGLQVDRSHLSGHFEAKWRHYCGPIDPVRPGRPLDSGTSTLVQKWSQWLLPLLRSGRCRFSRFSEDVKVTSTTSQEVGKGQGQRRGHPLYAPGLLASLNPGDSTSTTSDLSWKCNRGRSWVGEVGRHFTDLQAGLPGPRCWEMSALPASGAAYPDTPRHPKMGGR